MEQTRQGAWEHPSSASRRARRRLGLGLCAATLVGTGITALSAGPAGASGPLIVTPGAPVNVTTRAGNQLEAAVAVDPTNPQRIVVASNDETRNLTGIFFARSNDGGATWTRGAVGTGAAGDGFTPACCDPTLAFDQFGNLFVGYLGFPAGGGRTIELLTSNDGGATFTSVGPLDTGNALDQPTVTTGPAAGGGAQVWATWRTAGNNIMARGRPVTALGTVGALGALQTVEAGGGNFGDIAIGPGGQVTTTYQRPTGGQGPATIWVSTDADGLGAGAFGAPVAATTTNVGGFDFIPPQPDRSVDAEAGLAYDRSGGANNGRLYLVYTEENPDESGDTNVLLRWSGNNGATWSAPVTVNDDGTTRSQFLPRLAVDQTTGNVGVSFHDARRDNGTGPNVDDRDGTANNDAHLFAAVSNDGGATFSANALVSDAASDEDGAQPPAACCADLDYGDYAGVAFVNNTLYPVWADNSNSTADNPDGALNRFDVYLALVAVTVNQPPSVSAGPDVATDEGTAVPVTGSGNDPDGDTVTYTWSAAPTFGVDPGGACVFADPNLAATTVTCTDDGTYTATLSASDGIHAAVVDTATVQVTNVAPTANITAPADGSLYQVGALVTVDTTFGDAGGNDTHTCTADWDDGTSSAGVIGAPGSCSAGRSFTSAGVYTIVVTVSDDDGDSASDTVMVVVFDPSAGFVTGGGWINSPAGAYALNPAATGKANFGFVSKYVKGATTPTGETEFQFTTASLDFHSASYQWLVVSGPKAQYKGVGSLNGVSGYGFLLTATDGQQPGGGGADRFRIKIWDVVTGVVVYDNVAGASDDVDAANPQLISGGSIVIHKK